MCVLRTVCLILLTLLMIGPTVAKNSKKPRGRADSIAVRFAPAEIEVIRGYYVSHPTSLPPGLQKKLARGKSLPPGWQKKLHPFPAQLEARLPYPCGYCGRGVMDGYGVIYDKRTSIILDIVQLVADIVR